MSKQSNSIVYREDVIPFVAAAAGYCALVEPQSTPGWTRETLAECRARLAEVYAQGIALRRTDFLPPDDPEQHIRQEDYDAVRSRLEKTFGEYDRFLTTQVEEMKYSDVPVSVSTSELLADLYQALGDTVWAFRGKDEPQMILALEEIRDQLQHELGALLLIVLKQLHDLLLHPDFEPYSTAQDH